MWDWKLLPNLSLTNAVRLDRMNLGRNGYVPCRSPTMFQWMAASLTGFAARIALALSGQNLLHDEQQQISAAAVERRVLVTVTMDF